MPYTGIPLTLIEEAGAKEGDRISLKTKDRTAEGVLMPHHDFSGTAIITLKLDTGYNMGIKVAADTILKKIADAKPPSVKPVPKAVGKGDRPIIAFLSTGGTIASYVDYRTGAVHPARSSEDLLFANPDIGTICEPRAEVIASILSEDMTPDIWKKTAEAVKKAFDGGAKGVVVTHGTDTMGYTAAALAFMLHNLPGPVVLVGSQRSSDRPSSDAALNLAAATRVAMSPLKEVVVVMHASMSDTRIAIHRATKVRKMHSSRRDAFQSVNAPILGFVEGDDVCISELAVMENDGPFTLKPAMDERATLLWTHPAMSTQMLDAAFATSRGIVIAGTGLGHAPEKVIEHIGKALGAGKIVAMATQCLHGQVDMKVYSRGREMMRMGVVPAGDMLPETAYVKLMWAMGQEPKDDEEAIKLFVTDVAGELTPMRRPDEGDDRDDDMKKGGEGR